MPTSIPWPTFALPLFFCVYTTRARGRPLALEKESSTPRIPWPFCRKFPLFRPPEKETTQAEARNFSFRLYLLTVPPNAGTRRLVERFDTGPRSRWPGFEPSLLVPVLGLIFSFFFLFFCSYLSPAISFRSPTAHTPRASYFYYQGAGRGTTRKRKPHPTQARGW